MERLSDKDMAKLPKWARDHLTRCYNHIDSLARDKATLFRLPQGEAKVILPHFHGISMTDDDDQPLNHHQRVRFFPFGQAHHRYTNYVEVGLDLNRPGEVNVHTQPGVLITPHATNSFNVKLDRERG